MADTKTTGLTANTTPILTDIMPMVDDPGGAAATQKITLQNLRRQLFPYGVCGGRLTLTTATPVTTADVTAAGTLYFTPYSAAFGCGQVGLYDGSSGWDVLNFTELSLNIAAYTASKPYDIWIYNNSGTAALESTVWTDATNRATALTTQDGIYVKTGATTRRYLGTIYINSSGGQTDDSITKRNVWNYYNRVRKNLRVVDTTNYWNYTTAVWRSLNNSTANRFELTIGVSEEIVEVQHYGHVYTAGATSNQAAVGIALDATNANNAGITEAAESNGASNTAYAIYRAFIAAGYHFIQATEYSNCSGGGALGQYIGDNGTTFIQVGMTGITRC